MMYISIVINYKWHIYPKEFGRQLREVQQRR